MAWTAASLGCESVQVFSRSPRGGKAKPLAPEDVAAMKKVLSEKGIYPVVVHVPYYLNLASTNSDTRAYSLEVLVDDLLRTETLGGKYVVTHIGHKEKDEPPESPDALARVLSSLKEALSRYDGPVKILLENTAGQGQEIGSSFEAIGALLGNLPLKKAGACLDTCHAFGAGYDIRGQSGVAQILTDFDGNVGLARLCAIHMNDSKGDLGSHIDRHAHLGKGKIGSDTFKALLLTPALPGDLPGLLETPVDQPGDDLANVEALKKLRFA